MTNWNLLGHAWAVNLLQQHIAHDATRHAYLITGAPGLGRRTLALRFAQALNCTQLLAPGQPCGTCRTCKQIDAQQHPDLAIIEPTIKNPNNPKELIPGTNGEIRIEQIRELQKVINLKPYQSKYRVLVFQRFHQANIQSSNALLKTLEEAPSYVVIILTADNAEMLLPTIVSRCEVLRLRPLPIDAIESALTQRGADQASARLIAHLSGGRPGYAFRLQSDPDALAFRAQRLDDLQKLLSSTRVEKFAYIEKLSRDKEAFRNTLLVWGAYWHDVMLTAAGSSAALTNADRVEEIHTLASQLSLADSRRRVDGIEQSLDRLDKNVNARLLGENLLLEWTGYI